jgi:uncharacterized protein (DUF305 family)
LLLASASAETRSSRLIHIDSLDIVDLDQLSDNGVVTMTKRMGRDRQADCDLVGMMVSHHKGAMIVMTQVVLRYGRSQRVASENSRDPAEEITAMLLGIGKELPWSAASPTRPGCGSPALVR